MNRLKSRLAAGETGLGLWQALASPYTAEICAGSGFDWLLFDGEHAPNTIPLLLAQLQAAAPYDVEPVGRLPVGDPVLIKQYLDIGFRTLLAPMVDSAGQAEQLVAATRYPPEGVRGVASSLSRAARFGAIPDYLHRAAEGICLFAQIESRAGLEAIDEIAAVAGIDGLFVGPADLAASLGHLGDPRHADVQQAIAAALASIQAAGKIAGIFALDAGDARRRIAEGFRFVSLGSDIALLDKGARGLLAAVRG